jgi:hypothetical protein
MMSRGLHTANTNLNVNNFIFDKQKARFELRRDVEMKRNFYGLTGTLLGLNFYFHVALCLRFASKFHFGAQKN